MDETRGLWAWFMVFSDGCFGLLRLIEMLAAASLCQISLQREIACLCLWPASSVYTSAASTPPWVAVSVQVLEYGWRFSTKERSVNEAALSMLIWRITMDFSRFKNVLFISSHCAQFFFLLQILAYVEWTKIWIRTSTLKSRSFKPFILYKLIMLKVCDKSGRYRYLCPSIHSITYALRVQWLLSILGAIAVVLYLWWGSFNKHPEKDFMSISSVLVLHFSSLAETWEPERAQLIFFPLEASFSAVVVVVGKTS